MSAPNETPNVPRKPTVNEVMRTMRFKKKVPAQPAPPPLPPSPGPPPGSVPSPPRLVHFADGSGWRWSGPSHNPTNRVIHPLPSRPQNTQNSWLPGPFDFTAPSQMPNINTSANNPHSQAQGSNSTPRFPPRPPRQSNNASGSMPQSNASVPTTAVPRSRRNALVPPSASTSQEGKPKASTDQPVQGSSSGKRRRRTDPTSDDEDSNKRTSKRRVNKEIKSMAKNYRLNE
ncbi:uncharacterized protein MELLADRAFT_85747 [Melampsora larici-populina 98AG31]|uniref:Uncharacterized protein n=1 Tax=Melampsora larici-populina (strain 98AG31 / pathotype 3-4-7) TaxID=747676 RepID=F4RJM5_MELLP|nr:uncharacterized protein MELLADRAFT_85747 [Melampsora larici-populina 98AG31]EGG07332.1 hypothetical protein MELLADRAFT_85747 [Melampsora larici-populina 98AG31]